MMKLYKILRRFWGREVSLWNTIFFNFRVLPLHDAIKLPFILGKYIQFENIDKLDVKFEKGVHFAMVSLGLKHWPISATKYNYSLIKCSNNSCLVLGDNIIINPGFSLVIYGNAALKLGSDIYINQKASIYVKSFVQICNGSHIGWNCQIYDNSFHLIYSDSDKTIKSPFGRIIIGEKSWIANGCTISGNVYIPSQSIVAALSLVNKDFSYVKTTGNLFAGCPATIKKSGYYRVFPHKIQREMFKKFKNNPLQREMFIDEYTIKDLQEIDTYNNFY